MRLSCKYEILMNILQDVSGVVEDVLADAETQNVIFRFTREPDGTADVQIVGYSPTLTYKRKFGDPSSYSVSLEPEDVDENGVRYIQIKSRELLGFLNTYRNMQRTEVKSLVFEPVQNRVKCTVIEKIRTAKTEKKAEAEEGDHIFDEVPPEAPKSEEDSREFVSQYMFKSIPMKRNIINLIEYAMPEDGFKTADNLALLTNTEPLFKLLENSSTLYGTINFIDTHAVVVSRSSTTLMENWPERSGLTGIFVDIGLTYKLVQFINKVVGRNEQFDVARVDNKLFFRMATDEACLTLTKGSRSFEKHISAFKTEHSIVIDKLYFEDILKRVSLSDSAISFTIRAGEEYMTLDNGEYSQDISFEKSRGMEGFEGLKFSANPGVVTSALLDVKSSNADLTKLYISFCQSDSNAKDVLIFFSDKSNKWFTLLRSKTT